MGETFRLVLRSLLLSLVMGCSCQIFLDTFAVKRKFRHPWVSYAVIPAFAAGFMVIAVTKIPPYVLQPVRVIIVMFLVVQLFYQIGVIQNLMLSVIFCGSYWLVSALFFSIVYITPALDNTAAADMLEPLLDTGYLCLMLLFRYWFRRHGHGLPEMQWWKLGLLSMVGIAVSIAVVLIPSGSGAEENYARLAMIVGFAAVYLLGIHYMFTLLEKEAEVQRLRIIQERTRNQMNLYRSMKERYEQQRRFRHDYQNQLGCIQGMIEDGRTQEALQYISGFTGSVGQGELCVNTNHAVVNIMLSRKYREACDKGIVMTMVCGDLSGLTVSEEDIVTLLGNLLDNAIEACERLEENRVIRFKMVAEAGSLVLSVHNPVQEQVQIREHRIVTSKRDKTQHGIGLLNVDVVIRKNKGTSILKCEDGWFHFTAMLPIDEAATGAVR